MSLVNTASASVGGERVLDLFCANGTFSLEAALAGTREVAGLDFSLERVECAHLLAGTLDGKVDCSFDFVAGDVYELPSLFSEPFDVVIALGGFCHIADPPYVLKKVADPTEERFIVQTSSILPRSGQRTKFVARSDRTGEGLSSIRGGYGVWKVTVDCFRGMLAHTGFEVQEERHPPDDVLKRFLWYCALA